MITATAILLAGLLLQTLTMRGGAFHNALARRAAETFQAAGFTTRLEHPVRLPDGRLDFIDLLATRADITLACEVETTPRYAVVNAEKAALLAIALYIVTPTRQVRDAVQKRLDSRASSAKPRTRILLLTQLPQALATSEAFVFPGEWRGGKERK